jgi:uncharacterized membrane protein HdeD (DUF308 family)
MPQIALFMLALFDILSGLLLYFHPVFASDFFIYFSIICLAKGGWSILSAFISKFYFEFLGVLDIVVGIFLFMLYRGISLPFFSIFGVIIILKGIWSMFFSITMN